MIKKILNSYVTMIVLLLILGFGAAIGTFIENDFGSERAKEVVYHNYWYALLFVLASINLVLILKKTNLLLLSAKSVFHLALILILIGAGITHYFGLEGYMYIREGEKSNVVHLGDETHELPFFIYLKDFELTRYPGSQAPSEYKSYVKIIDSVNVLEEDAAIYMNNTLKYDGYKFFQTSYDTDELGTQLTVNKDPGVEMTYLGYFLLFIGLIWNLFDKNSRFQFLLKKIGQSTAVYLLIPLLVFLTSSKTMAQEYSPYIEEYLEEFAANSKTLADEFGTLVVQDPDGRMKPLDSQNKEILYKLTGRGSWNGMNANQVLLGMFSRPKLWQNLHLIKVKTPRLKAALGMEEGQKLARFNDFFDEFGNYIIAKEVERANKLVPSKRGTYERDLIKVDERLNVAFMSIRGVLLNVFPIPEDHNHTWVDFKTMFSTFDGDELQQIAASFLDAVYNRNFENGLEQLAVIKSFQQEHGYEVLPTDEQIEMEIWYNQSNLFIKLSVAYLLFGFFLLIYNLISIFNNKLINRKLSLFMFFVGLILITIHTIGIAVRWYIGGFAPLSNTYETMIYIAYSAVIAGVFFFRKSTIAMSAAMIVAGIFIFSAYLGEIDPKITSLVPVLKSFWLSLHVSVITASYGFFAVGMLLGIINLFLFVLRDLKREHIDKHIQSLSYINEVTLILGLSFLVIGNFLGGIWANKSWGRYWGWDPKETWAYVSIIVYTIVLHMRLLKKYDSPYIFNVLSVLAFFSILMTYYGVNFYLAGLHSYATGDPVPIPSWVYYSVGSLLLLIVISYPKRNLNY